ncbi:hypothetical protein ACO229_06780 [Promicromonospora sp. MS192]|uniref:hypothetical protein n=1 Tax=Promicromonospora sp. MS192 TaxID=3412684 RepID=UPI003C2E0C2C
MTSGLADAAGRRARANQGWDAEELSFRDRFWDEARWDLEERWPRGLRVRVNAEPLLSWEGESLAGQEGAIRRNRVLAADDGAWVAFDSGMSALIHWRRLDVIADPLDPATRTTTDDPAASTTNNCRHSKRS